MKLLYGTGNPAKLNIMREYLSGLNIQIIGLMDLNTVIPYVPETGSTPLENAVIKAKAYYKAFQMPVFSCDSGLYFENLPDELSPKVNVRNVNGKCLTDDEMIEYYSGIARKYGDIIASYHNAICFVYDENHIFSDFCEDLQYNRFVICNKPYSDETKRMKGFPLDCLSKNIETGEYFYDITNINNDSEFTGFKRFFIDIIKNNPDLFNNIKL